MNNLSLNEPCLPFEMEETSICFGCEGKINKNEREESILTTHKGRRVISVSDFVSKAGKVGLKKISVRRMPNR